MKRWMAAIVISMACALQARAGAWLVNETTNDSSNVMTSRISVGDNSIRVDVQGEKGTTTLIYRGDLQVFWMVNDKDKTFTEMTQAQLDKMAEAMNNLPPAMRKMMGAGAADVPKYVKKADGQKVGQWTATLYEAEGKKGPQDLWTVPVTAIHLTEADLGALKGFSKFFGKFGVNNKDDFFRFDRNDLGFTGIPVKTVMMEGGKAKRTSILKEAAKKDFPASTFNVPAGYTKKEMKGM